MSEISEIRELGETAYGGYCQASGGKSLVSGASLPLWDEQAPEIRQAWNLAAMAVVDRWQQAGEDAPGSEPQPAKVIVVRDENGREHRYAAPNFGILHDGTLLIGDKRGDGELRVDAARAPGRWASACKDDVAAPDSTATALGIARRALEEIAKTVLEADDPRREVVRVARNAAEEIFTETEL